jgi:hypothetical protein
MRAQRSRQSLDGAHVALPGLFLRDSRYHRRTSSNEEIGA